MIEVIPNMPDNIVGFVATGEVSAQDYETVFIPAIESTLKENEKVRILYHIAPEFTGFTAGALWDDVKIGVAHLRAWEKIAVVTDSDWIRRTGGFLNFVLPCPVKVFPNAELDEATQWIAD
ncbi:MAG: STAS/SEC14 domain-containing protein [Pseudomonadota bacterium]